MNTFFKIFLYSFISGSAVVIGGYLGTKDIPDKLLAFILTFGSGVMLAVLSYSLMHEAYKLSGPYFTSLAFVMGGIALFFLERLLSRHITKGVGMILGTALDDLPEALSMGIGFATDEGKLGIVLAFSIFLHNIPEGICSTRELIDEAKLTSKSAILLAIIVGLLNPLAALTGYYILRSLDPIIQGMLLAFSGGSVLFMTGTNMIPKAHEIGTKLENFGMLAGFLAAFLLSRLM